MRDLPRLVLCLLGATFLAMGATGCATGEDGSGLDDVSQNPTDLGNLDGAGLDGGADQTMPEADVTMPPDTSMVADVSDTTPPAEVSMPLCPTGYQSCVSDVIREVCSPDGNGFVQMSCAAGEKCEGGACVEKEVVCPAMSKTCANQTTLHICSADGTEVSPQSCGVGRCVENACTTGTNVAGTLCTQGSECGGGTCACTSGCPAPLDGGVCTTAGCDVWGCSDDEVCTTSDIGLGAGAFCMPKCTRCDREGFACQNLRTILDGAEAWSEVCAPTLAGAALGAKCQSDTDCIGGLCLTHAPGGKAIDGGYCSNPCTTQGGCTEGGSCVKRDGYLEGKGFCALDCVSDQGSRACPPSRPATFDLDCRAEVHADDSGSSFVCFQK